MLQGDIFSPVAFIAGIWQIFTKHDTPGAGVTVGESPYAILISKLEYAYDTAMMHEDKGTASVRLTAISNGSQADASMEISLTKTMDMHVYAKEKVTDTTEAEVVAL